MLQYLAQYGINSSQKDVRLDVDLDIVDKMNLENQINNSRHNMRELISLMDQIQTEYLETTSKIRAKKREIIINVASTSTTARNDAMLEDDEYQDLLNKEEALKYAIQTVKQQMDYVQNDMRTLNSIFYAKF